MKLFQAVAHVNAVPLFYRKTHRKLNVLVSYAYQEGNISKLTKTYRSAIEDLYLDSGAFSVFTGRKRISLKEYIIFLVNTAIFLLSVSPWTTGSTTPITIS
jgi:hypothetical protein